MSAKITANKRSVGGGRADPNKVVGDVTGVSVERFVAG